MLIGAVRTGSSPLTRGKPSNVAPRRRMRRLIPAHAGKTSSLGTRSPKSTAHPRSRGENGGGLGEDFGGFGSSPLTRGKRGLRPVRGLLRRLIPAHAGKTQDQTARQPRLAAHPRSRGENGSGVFRHPPRVGSSPLTRGKPNRRGRRICVCRLIPAHAGKTPP